MYHTWGLGNMGRMLNSLDLFGFFLLQLLPLIIYPENQFCWAQVVLENNEIDSQGSECNLFEGIWVNDESYPLYGTSNCPFIDKEFNCQKNGRPDHEYLKYGWKPNDCALPRFNGQDLLNRLKGKKVLFVGDSLSYNQWQSLTCMLHAAVPIANYSSKGSLYTLFFPEYEASVMYSLNHFLVDLVQTKKGMVLKLDSIENGNSWKGYDMLIFNTWHWWIHTEQKKPWDYIEVGGKLVKDMDRLAAFGEGLTTWSRWVDSNVDPSQTRVFFQGISPSHYNGQEWGDKATTCLGQTEPISGSTYPGASPPAAAVVNQVLTKMSHRVTLLDITLLSQLRKDGHPSLYGIDGKKGNDCSHWCLAGVPDTWNQLLYAMVVTN